MTPSSAQQMLDVYTEERSHPVKQAQSKDQDLLGRDWNVPSLPTTRQGMAMLQPEGNRHIGLLSPLREPEDTHIGRANGFLPFQNLGWELNEAG